jgi:hypothetical protein
MRALFSVDYPPSLMLSVKTYNSYWGLIVLIVFLHLFYFLEIRYTYSVYPRLEVLVLPRRLAPSFATS